MNTPLCLKQWKGRNILLKNLEMRQKILFHENLFFKSCKQDRHRWLKSLKRLFLSLLSPYVPLFQKKPPFHSFSNLIIGKTFVINQVLSALSDHVLTELYLSLIHWRFLRVLIISIEKTCYKSTVSILSKETRIICNIFFKLFLKCPLSWTPCSETTFLRWTAKLLTTGLICRKQSCLSVYGHNCRSSK